MNLEVAVLRIPRTIASTASESTSFVAGRALGTNADEVRNCRRVAVQSIGHNHAPNCVAACGRCVDKLRQSRKPLDCGAARKRCAAPRQCADWPAALRFLLDLHTRTVACGLGAAAVRPTSADGHRSRVLVAGDVEHGFCVNVRDADGTSLGARHWPERDFSRQLSGSCAISDETRRGSANGVVIAGSPLGQALGTFAGGLLIAEYGWRALFIGVGVLSLLWLLPWSGQHLPQSTLSTPESKPPPLGRLLRCRALWGMGIGQFGYNYILYFCLTWLPMYLVKDRGFAIEQMAAIGGAIYLVYAASSIGAGWICDRRVRAGVSVERARKTSAVGGALGVAACMALCAVAGPAWSIALLFAASLCKGFCAAVNFANAQTLAGPTAAGRWVGIQNCLGNIAGIVAPALTGVIVERSGSYTYAFAATAAAALLGAFGYGVIVQRVTPVIWSAAPSRSPVTRQSLAVPLTPELVDRGIWND
jgi:MFS family permease